jgi:hypothetical protein
MKRRKECKKVKGCSSMSGIQLFLSFRSDCQGCEQIAVMGSCRLSRCLSEELPLRHRGVITQG